MTQGLGALRERYVRGGKQGGIQVSRSELSRILAIGPLAVHIFENLNNFPWIKYPVEFPGGESLQKDPPLQILKAIILGDCLPALGAENVLD